MKPPQLPQHWPYRHHSRFIASKPHLWHVQDIGTGPILLLIHGAGGATHSFRHLIPLLPNHRLIAIDVAGQGFTTLGAKNRCGLDAVAQDIAALIRQEHWHPLSIIGHSAGVAIALRLAELIPIKSIIGINAALGEFEGVQGWLFPVMAKLLALTPFVPQLFSRIAGTRDQTRRFLTSTGSRIEPEGEAQYQLLLQKPGHVEATLAMMSQWSLTGLMARLPQQKTPCLLITGSEDRAVPARISRDAATQMPHGQWIDLPGYGHLVHEEAAEQVAPLILQFLADQP